MKKFNLFIAAIGLATLGTFLLVYSPTLFDFLTAGDFYFMIWAHNAMSHPEMLMAKYCNHSTEAVMSYRPNLYMILFLGYKLWKFQLLRARSMVSVPKQLQGRPTTSRTERLAIIRTKWSRQAKQLPSSWSR